MSSALLHPLAHYGIDTARGFVPAADPLLALPAAYAAWDEIGTSLPPLLRSHKLRDTIRTMPELEFGAEHPPLAQERALMLLTMLVNAWVWSGPAPEFRIPSNLARPVCAVAQRLGRPPIVHFAGLNLYNWRRIDPAQPVSTDNATLLAYFSGGVDEDWFFIVTMGVELAGAPALSCVADAVAAAERNDTAAATSNLETIATTMHAVQHALTRMREWCDPHVFYNRIRPWVSGWPAPGAIYEGVSEAPVVYAGGSAGQSALIQSLDALLGIEHTAASGYLKMIRAYMPIGHRQFVVDVEKLSKVRALCIASGGDATKAYDAAVAEVDKFRRMHMGLAMDYINKPSGKASGALGTGGTDFTDFLRDARKTTARAKIEPGL
jgi:indoleamine 2,3-dioxygenase